MGSPVSQIHPLATVALYLRRVLRDLQCAQTTRAEDQQKMNNKPFKITVGGEVVLVVSQLGILAWSVSSNQRWRHTALIITTTFMCILVRRLEMYSQAKAKTEEERVLWYKLSGFCLALLTAFVFVNLLHDCQIQDQKPNTPQQETRQ
jgi:UDP-N-acetylmuramyl pentapeptide phosphotransferase/UDP-N-acetylglucosamine-1-phosphate transferase